MIIIVQSTAIVAATGIESTVIQLQGGDVSQSDALIQHGDVVGTGTLVQATGIAQLSRILQASGVEQLTYIAQPSIIELQKNAEFIVFPGDFSRSVYLVGVAGTTLSLERFFDRSPWFFTPSEADPTTLRDISEAQQFMLFSDAVIESYEAFRNIPTVTTIVTEKGDTFSRDALLLDNAIANGDFEQGLSNWEVLNLDDSPHPSTSVTVTATLGAYLGTCPPGTEPPQGSQMLAITNAWDDLAIVSENFFTTKLSSEAIESFSVSMAACEGGSADFSLYIQFFDGDVKEYELRYSFSGRGAPHVRPNFSYLDLSPTDTVGLGSFTSPSFATFTSNTRKDIQRAAFSFDKVRFVIAAAVDFGQWLIDDIQLNLSLEPDQLKRTSSIASIDTGHPTASGSSATISGSDDITQVDLSPPFFGDLSPSSGVRQVPESSKDVEFHIQDVSTAVDQSSIDVFIDDEQVVTAGVAFTGATWASASKTVLAPNDIQYIFTRGENFPGGVTVNVSGSFADLATPANGAEGAYNFTIVGSGSIGATISGGPDVTAPTIIPTEPVDLAAEVSPDTEVKWSITDDASGVDPSTVKLLLSSGTVLQDDAAVVGSFSRVSNTSRGYDYTYVPPASFGYGSTITGSIEASDFDGNISSLAYQFTVTSGESLRIENFFLDLGESALLTSGTLISVDVVDETYGVASGTTTFTVNGVVPSGLLTVYSGAGPDRVLFSVPAEPLVNYREDLTVVVHAENQFPGNYPVVEEQQFTLRPGYGVQWPNKTEDAEGGPETIFPYIQNIQVLAEVKNFAKTFGEASAYFRFLTEEQATKDLGASIISNIQTADLPAVLESINPFFEYGKTMVLEIEADDLEGNQFSLTHTFVIEPRP